MLLLSFYVTAMLAIAGVVVDRSSANRLRAIRWLRSGGLPRASKQG